MKESLNQHSLLLFGRDCLLAGRLVKGLVAAWQVTAQPFWCLLLTLTCLTRQEMIFGRRTVVQQTCPPFVPVTQCCKRKLRQQKPYSHYCTFCSRMCHLVSLVQWHQSCSALPPLWKLLSLLGIQKYLPPHLQKHVKLNYMLLRNRRMKEKGNGNAFLARGMNYAPPTSRSKAQLGWAEADLQSSRSSTPHQVPSQEASANSMQPCCFSWSLPESKLLFLLTHIPFLQLKGVCVSLLSNSHGCIKKVRELSLNNWVPLRNHPVINITIHHRL